MWRVFLQCFLLIVAPVISLFIPLQDSLYFNFEFNFVKVGFADNSLLVLLLSEVGISLLYGLVISVILLFFLRKFNSDKVFNAGNSYGQTYYPLYFIASKVLGYKSISLIRVPIYLHFKIVISDLFDRILVDENIKEVKQKVYINRTNLDKDDKELNLILNDTYLIHPKNIPSKKLELPTITITNGNQLDVVRKYNPKFVDAIREQTHEASKKYTKVNIFATTNTKHSKQIIEQCFKNAGRTGFQHLTVFQFDTELKLFNEEYAIF